MLHKIGPSKVFYKLLKCFSPAYIHTCIAYQVINSVHLSVLNSNVDMLCTFTAACDNKTTSNCGSN